MKTLLTCGTLGLAAVLAAGCQETTTTGPAARTDSSGAPSVKKLSVMAAEAQTIERGDTDKVLVTINRDNFDDPVTISLNDLPPGVVGVQSQAVIPAGSNTVTLELKASDDAAVGEHQVKINATAPGLAQNVQVFKLTVKEKG